MTEGFKKMKDKVWLNGFMTGAIAATIGGIIYLILERMLGS